MRKPIPNMSFMITSAIRHLRQAQGSTSKEIMNYITSRYDSLEPAKLRQISATLKRGLDYGILQKSRGHYKLNSMGECKTRKGGVPMVKPAQRRGKKQHRGSAKKKKKKKREGHGDQRSKGRDTAKSRTDTCAGRCRCIATRGRNAYALEADIPGEQLQEQSPKDVVCYYENMWKGQGDNGTDSTDPSRSTLESDTEVNDNRDGAEKFVDFTE